MKRTRKAQLVLSTSCALGCLGCEGAIDTPNIPELVLATAGSAPSVAAVTSALPDVPDVSTAAPNPSTPVAAPPATSVDVAVTPPACDVARVGLTKLRRLTQAQLNHTLRDLLGTDGTPAEVLAPDERVGPFTSNAITPITDLLVQQHDELAAALAAGKANDLAAVIGCELTGTSAVSCAGRFIEEFGLKAYRRPLTAEETAEYVQLFTDEAARTTPSAAFELVLSTLLSSPFFLYHVNVGTSGVPSSEPAALTDYEMASRLSYFLWQTMPDTELLTLAAAGMLSDESVLEAQVARLLTDSRALDSIPEFHLQWLGIGDLAGLDKDTATYPNYDEALGIAMQRETARFTDYVVRRGDALMSTLFTAPFSFPEGPLFTLYGIDEPSGFTPGAVVEMNPAERAGILTQAGFLAAHAHRESSSPVHRGIAVRENMLCQPLNPPPPGVSTSPKMPSADATIRDILSEHEANPDCSGCHLLIDPIGLGFENYDGIGAYRVAWNADGTQPVDPSGQIYAAGSELDGTFVGAIELGQKLAGSPAVANCLANQWFRYSLGRMESVDDDCSLAKIRDGFAASGYNVRQLIASIVKSDAFRNVRNTAVSP